MLWLFLLPLFNVLKFWTSKIRSLSPVLLSLGGSCRRAKEQGQGAKGQAKPANRGLFGTRELFPCSCVFSSKMNWFLGKGETRYERWFPMTNLRNQTPGNRITSHANTISACHWICKLNSFNPIHCQHPNRPLNSVTPIHWIWKVPRTSLLYHSCWGKKLYGISF